MPIEAAQLKAKKPAMLNTLIDWSAKNRFLILLATLFIIIAGIWSLAKTPLDAIPDLSDVQVILYTCLLYTSRCV